MNCSGNACESLQDRRSTGSIRPKLSVGRQTTRWFTSIKSAICWLSPRTPGCTSHSTADATNYQLFWKLNLSGLEHESLSKSANCCSWSSTRLLLQFGRYHSHWCDCVPKGLSYMWSSVLLFLALIFVLQYCST